jgi:biotin carboxyl carrier protein
VRYYVTLGSDPTVKPVTVDLIELPNGALEARVDDRPVEVDFATAGADISVRVDGQIVDLSIEGVPPDLGVVASGHRSYVHVETDRMRSGNQASRANVSSGERVIKSPMPGRVVKVLVSVGDPVDVGQPLVVLEAMKMENEIRAPVAGTVAEVYVTAGMAVEGNAKLAILA